MRMSASIPSFDALPFFRTDTPRSLPTGASQAILRADKVAAFDALLHEIHPDAARVDFDRMQHLVDWLLAMPPKRAQSLVDERIARIAPLRSMLADPDWDTGPAMQARLRKLLDYIERDDDMIADHQPVVGLLDDIVLIELSWPAFSTEVENYEDFCAYRLKAKPLGDGAAQRAAWVRDGLSHMARWKPLLETNDPRYLRRGRSDRLFRIG